MCERRDLAEWMPRQVLDWGAAAFATVTRPQAAGIRSYGYLYMVIGLVGTTIAPC